MHLGGTALVLAAEALIDKAKRIAAHLLQAPIEEVGFDDGVFKVDRTDRSITLGEVAVAARDAANLPDDMAPGLEAIGNNLSDLYTFPNGCHVAEVEIDPETGSVRLDRYLLIDDFGRLLNPQLTLGQVHGGVAQGIGQALYETVAYDQEGQLLTASYQDYCIPRASDIPAIEVTLDGSAPCRTNPLGAKGCGESGAIGGPPCITNGVMDALAPLGITTLDTPLSPVKIWQAIRDAEKRAANA
jgi:carbon-monoxide dehydrogenase large subunit